jgi:hypothetical protein
MTTEMDFIPAYSTRVKSVLRETVSDRDDEADKDKAADESERFIFDNTSVDIKAKLRASQSQAERDFLSGYSQHQRQQLLLGRSPDKPERVTALDHKSGCLWRADAIDPDAYGPQRDVCTCGGVEWHVRIIPVQTKGAYGNATTSRADNVLTAAVENVRIRHRAAKLGAAHGAISGQGTVGKHGGSVTVQGPTFNNPSYMAAWNAERVKLNRRYAKSDAELTALFDWDVAISKHCTYCGTRFLPKRTTGRYCCANHRLQAHRRVPFENPALRCDEMESTPIGPLVCPPKPDHDKRCLWRRNALAEDASLSDLCTCGMSWHVRAAAVETLTRKSEAENHQIAA